MVGSSIIKNAFLEARQSPGGVNLGLERLGVSIWWQGRGGLVLNRVRSHIRTMLNLEDLPHIIIVHVGGNDIGQTQVGILRNQLKNLFSWLADLIPGALLVWSQILPRRTWRYSDNNDALDKARCRINSSVGSFVTKSGGGYIRYPDIKANNRFLKVDGVHLTPLGNNILLNTIQGALEVFLSRGACTYPDQAISFN